MWQTAVELEPRMFYMMLLGGPGVTNMSAVLNNPAQFGETPPAFTPATHNFCIVAVTNSDGTTGVGGFQPLRIN